MSLTPGAKLGPYEILAPLGASGMGHVNRKTTSLHSLAALYHEQGKYAEAEPLIQACAGYL